MRRIQKHVNGYQIRIKLGGELQFIWFGHTACGGKRKALDAAIKERDRLEILHGLKVNIWSDIKGVTFKCRYLEDRLYPYCAYVASWRETIAGKRVNKTREFSFKFNDYADEVRAKKQAISLRKKMEALHYG